MIYFGGFIIFITLGFYAGSINSSLFGVDLTSASDSIVNLFKIGFWAVGLGILFSMSEVFK
jgi:hypothetical protein